MPNQSRFDFSRLDYRTLTAGQKDALLRWADQRARIERALAFRAGLAVLWAFQRQVIAAAAAAFADWRRAARARRDHAAATIELGALNDRTLKDIGVSRCEVPAVARVGKARPRRQDMTLQQARARVSGCASPFSAPDRPGSISPI